ncbi:MAG: DNA polymerase Y family protein [Acidobacteriota bacterium]
MAPRVVAHWDGDRFFASIEQAADRRLRGRAVVVGGERRGVVLSASPEARRVGIRPGWPVGRARRAVPDLVVVPAHFELYERFFDEILWLCQETTPLVEPASVGAAWLDLTGTERVNARDARAVMERIQTTVRQWLHVSISTGIAVNKLVSRLAARAGKPGGRLVVPPGRERAFLAPLPVAALPGLNREALEALDLAGIHRIGQVAALPADMLGAVLGRRALPLIRQAQGIADEPVGARRRSSEEGWAERIEFPEDAWEERLLLTALRGMLERLMAAVRAAGVEVRRLTLELRYTDRAESRYSVDLSEPSCTEDDALPLLPALLEGAWTRRVRLRAMTLRAGRVYRPGTQLALFDLNAEQRERRRRAAAVLDAVRKRFGAAALVRGADLLDKALALTQD